MQFLTSVSSVIAQFYWTNKMVPGNVPLPYLRDKRVGNCVLGGNVWTVCHRLKIGFHRQKRANRWTAGRRSTMCGRGQRKRRSWSGRRLQDTVLISIDRAVIPLYAHQSSNLWQAVGAVKSIRSSSVNGADNKLQARRYGWHRLSSFCRSRILELSLLEHVTLFEGWQC